jgi:hypothetical protein
MAAPVMSQNFAIGDINLDQIKWGMRKLLIDVENPREDSVRIDILIKTFYPQHYLSGLDPFKVETTIVIQPLYFETYEIEMEIPASFDRLISRVEIFWRYNQPGPDDRELDSLFQRFSNVFKARDDAAVYGERKHSIGPAYCMIDYLEMNFEYPRLILFLLSRGESLEAINSMFYAEWAYTALLVERMRENGFFPFAKDTRPGILAITENEAYAVKEKIKPLSEKFTRWFDEKGQKKLDEILTEFGVDDFTGGLPSIQMKMLLTLLEAEWVDPDAGFDISHFEKKEVDLQVQNKPKWIVQGGEFFMPKLCLAEFEEQGEYHVGTFSPDPSLPYDKAPVYDLRKAVEDASGAITSIDMEKFSQAVEKAKKKKLVKDISKDIMKTVEAAQADIEQFQEYQASYLADYIIRVMLGDYFSGHKPGDGLDCVRIRYQP